MSVSHNDADGGTRTQQALDHLVAVVERLDQLLLPFGSLADRQTDRHTDRQTDKQREKQTESEAEGRVRIELLPFITLHTSYAYACAAL